MLILLQTFDFYWPLAVEAFFTTVNRCRVPVFQCKNREVKHGRCAAESTVLYSALYIGLHDSRDPQVEDISTFDISEASTFFITTTNITHLVMSSPIHVIFAAY